MQPGLFNARIQNVLSEGVQLLLKAERMRIPLKAGHHRPASETPLKLRLAGLQIESWHGSFVIFQGSGPAMLLKKPFIFVIFQRGGGAGPLSPSGSDHVFFICQCHLLITFANSLDTGR